MHLLVCSHKPCWRSTDSPTGYATDGGFPFQMRALAELFDSTTLFVPCLHGQGFRAETPLTGRNLSIRPATPPAGRGATRKAALPLWLLRNARSLIKQVRGADAVHTPIPGDIGTIGMLLAVIFRKPLFVRHCGNWVVQRTLAERFWRWFMESFAGGRNVMVATGGGRKPPSNRNRAVQWIFSTALSQEELHACGKVHTAPADGKLRLNITCRQEAGKGTDVVLQSLPLLLRSFPRLQLDVVGTGTALQELEQLASALGVANRVQFHRQLAHPDVIRLLQEADVFCYPTSASDGFPKVVLEALACGVPVVTTPVSVLPHLIGGGCGVLAREASPEAVAEAVQLCVSDSEGYRSMSEKAVEVASEYSLERWRDSIAEMLAATWGPLRSND